MNIPLSSDIQSEMINISRFQARNIVGGSLSGQAIPEPASLVLLVLGGLAVLWCSRRASR